MATEFKDCEIKHFLRRFISFAALKPEDRLLHFDMVSDKFCSDEWREKFRTFFGQDRKTVDEKLLDAIINYALLNIFDLEKITICDSCCGAFWKLVFLSDLP